MNKTRKEIECLTRLQELTSCQEEMLTFLMAENVMTKDEAIAVQRAPDPAKIIQGHLAAISAANKIQLLEYNWNFLPVERIKILIVTDRNSKEFSYNY